MTIEIPDFTVEASSGGRFRVEWRDDGFRYHFLCLTDGDTVQQIVASPYFRAPTIYRYPLQGPGIGRVGYINAEDHKELCAGIASRILAQNLFTKARAEAEERRTQNEARVLADKAEFMRKVLGDLDNGSPNTDATLAAAYDRIQNGAI